jgi:cytochrome c556
VERDNNVPSLCTLSDTGIITAETHMQHPLARFVLVAASVLLAGGSVPARSEEPAQVAPLELRQVMQGMGRNMVEIVEAVNHEDWPKAGRAASAIANHPKPPMAERVRVLAFVGADLGKFRGFDEKAEEAAKALQDAASRADGQAVISSFAVLQGSCLGCHQSFRKPFVEHFYGKR